MRGELSPGAFAGLIVLALLVPLVGFIAGGLSIYWHLTERATRERGIQGAWLLVISLAALLIWMTISV